MIEKEAWPTQLDREHGRRKMLLFTIFIALFLFIVPDKKPMQQQVQQPIADSTNLKPAKK